MRSHCFAEIVTITFEVRRRIFILLSSILVCVGCASNNNYSRYAFELYPRRDSPNADLLGYKYGAGNFVGSSLPHEGRNNVPYDFPLGVTNFWPPASQLYVKWRSKIDDQIYERTVDLTNRMPARIGEACLVTFLVNHDQLRIFLIAMNRRDSGPRGQYTNTFKGRLHAEIYPGLETIDCSDR